MLVFPPIEAEDSIIFDDDTIASGDQALDFSSAEDLRLLHAHLTNVWGEVKERRGGGE